MRAPALAPPAGSATSLASNQCTALTIATGDAYTRAVGQAFADTLTMLFSDMHRNGFILNATFLLIVGGLGCLAVLLTTFLAPDAPPGIRTFLTTVGGVPEPVFMAWLLVRGARVTAGRLPAPA